jgi:uncharacterized protein (DUF3084 family)
MRATTASTQGAGSTSSTDNKSEVSKLIADKQQLQNEAEQARAEAAGAAKNLAAVKAQAQVGQRHLCDFTSLSACDTRKDTRQSTPSIHC